MQFRYFKADHLTSIEDAKKQYYKLCLRWHPDMAGGDEEAMKRINAEWDYLRKHNYNVHQSKDGGTYTDWSQDMPDDVTEQFADLVEQLIHMQGLEIEVCGSWLWVGGNTAEHKDGLKGMGMKWAPKKRRWYKAPRNWKRKHHGELSMEQIRNRFGSQRIRTQELAELTA